MTITMRVIDKRTARGISKRTFSTYNKAGEYVVNHYDKIIDVSITRGDFTFGYDRHTFMNVLKNIGFRKEVKI